MEQLAIRATRAALPNLDDADLEDVDTLTNRLGVMSDFRLVDAELRSMEVSDQHLTTGRIEGLRVERAKLHELRMDSVDFAGCDLSGATFTSGKWSRVRFANCKILSGHFDSLILEDVIFERCKLDYATFAGVTAKGPVIFRDCSLEETEFSNCDLSKVAFDECRMDLTRFERTQAKGLDLRGNDLSAIRGITSLKHAVIESAQALQLGRALVDDLELTLPGD